MTRMVAEMKWEKRGLIVSPGDAGDWAKTHAQVPTPLCCEGFFRVYFSSRPERGISLTTFVDLDGNDPARILRRKGNPILELGKPGTFDEHGIMPSCAVRNGDAVFLYYSGWSRTTTVPYCNSTGLAVSSDGGETFTKISEGPILGKSVHDPYSATSPFVIHDGSEWHMWYCSGTGWLRINEKYEHVYDIKYARSGDGILWMPSREAVIRQRTPDEAITRPCVLKAADGYHMWFCFRGSRQFRDGEDAYRIGYAFSEDLRTWRRDDGKAGIEPSSTGWDSNMVAYPSIVKRDSRTYMFYNGNDFGAEGFGYALLEA
jgi:predicted GH43/DUF377 family glycosyl hydrolase